MVSIRLYSVARHIHLYASIYWCMPDRPKASTYIYLAILTHRHLYLYASFNSILQFQLHRAVITQLP
jgi:hypothetical protein